MEMRRAAVQGWAGTERVWDAKVAKVRRVVGRCIFSVTRGEILFFQGCVVCVSVDRSNGKEGRYFVVCLWGLKRKGPEMIVTLHIYYLVVPLMSGSLVCVSLDLAKASHSAQSTTTYLSMVAESQPVATTQRLQRWLK